MSKCLLLPAALLLSATSLACESGVDVTGTVVAPPEVQRLFSNERPGEVLVDVGLADGHLRQRVGRLCAPADAPLTFPMRGLDLGCARGSATIVAWASPATVSAAGGAPCGLAHDELFQDRPVLEGALAQAQEVRPVSVSGGLGSCHDGSVSFALTLFAGESDNDNGSDSDSARP